LKTRAGDFLVWGGLVVDFADPEASRIFTGYHDRELVAHGVLGFKGDECDKQPPTDATPFNFPLCQRPDHETKLKEKVVDTPISSGVLT
jgi:alpha-D-xyloside xylohydrolase